MDDPIVRSYDESKNPEGLFLPGVPLSDIEQSRWQALPDWLKESADALGWYAAPAARSARKAKEE